jgi:hypothetical protein
MKRTKVGIIAVILLLGSFWPGVAEGYWITIEIEAVVDGVDDPDGYLGGQVNPGDIITGSYTYESTTPDSTPLDPIVGHYYHYVPPAGVSLSVGGFTFETDPANVEFLVGIVNDNQSGDDIYLLGSYNNLPLTNGSPVDRISWQLNDPTGSAISSDVLLTDPPILDQWESIIGLRLVGEKGAYIVDAHVTSAVPEPATYLLLTIGGIVLIRRKRK